MQQKNINVVNEKSMSSPKGWRPVGFGDLPIFVSIGTVNERNNSGRPRTRSRITTLRDRLLRGGSHFNNDKSGFTLIELLVVVLIIGILTAVAVPQYTLAVNKARFANLRSTATSLVKASEAYFLANNEWPTDIDTLSIDLPAGMTTSTVHGDGTCGVNNEMYCCVVPEGSFAPAIVCGRNDYSFAFHSLYSPTLSERIQYCIANQSDANATKLCKSLGKAINSWRFFTPEENKTGYMYYSLKE